MPRAMTVADRSQIEASPRRLLMRRLRALGLALAAMLAMLLTGTDAAKADVTCPDLIPDPLTRIAVVTAKASTKSCVSNGGSGDILVQLVSYIYPTINEITVLGPSESATLTCSGPGCTSPSFIGTTGTADYLGGPATLHYSYRDGNGETVSIDIAMPPAQLWVPGFNISGGAFNPEPGISAVSSNTGGVLGGNTLTISGRNLTGGKVAFGGAAATVIQATARQILLTTPPHALGTVDMVVTTADGTASAPFTYVLNAQTPLVAGATPGALAVGGTGTISVTGGSGAGALSSQVTAGASVCSVSGTTVTAASAGTCTIQVSKAGDTSYTAASTQFDLVVTAGATAQAAFTATPSPATIFIQDSASIMRSGGSGTGGYVATLTAGEAYCTLLGSTTVVGKAPGVCTVSVTKAGDATYQPATATFNLTVRPKLLPQAPLSLIATPAALSAGGSAQIDASGGSGTGVLSLAVSGGGCTLTGSTLATTALASSCIVTATKAGDADYLSATTSVTVPVSRGAAEQVALTASASPSTIAVGGTTTLSARGGSTAQAVTFAVTTGGAVCSIAGSTLTGLSAGTCTVTATRPGDATFGPVSTTLAIDVTAGQAAQAALSAFSVPSNINATTPGDLRASGGSGAGAVSFAVTGGTGRCALSGTTLNAESAGTCIITATKAGDATYKPATATATVTVVALPQAALSAGVTPSTIAVGSSAAISVSGGTGSGAFDYAVLSGGLSCAVNGPVVTGTGAGSCLLRVTKRGDGLYLLETTTTTLDVTGLAPQALLTVAASPAAPTVYGTTTLSTTGGSGTGAVTYEVTAGANACGVNGNVLTGLAVGTCTITATKAADATYAARTGTLTLTVARGTQTPLVATAGSQSIGSGQSTFISVSGGSGNGAVTYTTTNSSWCVLSGASPAGVTLTGTLPFSPATANCSVTVTKASDANFQSSVAGAVVELVTGTTPQNAITATASPTSIIVGGTSSLTVFGGSGNGAGIFTVTGGQEFCRIDAGTRFATGTGTGRCTISAVKGGNGTYAASNPVTLTLDVTSGGAPQAAFAVSASRAPLPVFDSASLGTAGGSGTGAVTYALTSGAGNCSLSGSVVTALAVGSCTVKATKAGDTSYGDTSATTTLTIAPAAQAALTASTSAASILVDGTATLGASGGSGSGAVTYAVTGGTGQCSLAGTTLTATGAGTCIVTATKAADGQYASASASVTVAVGRLNQTGFKLSATPGAIGPTGTATLTASGGGGTGTVSYALASGATACSLSGTSVTGLATGSCTITATRAEDARYTAATASTTVIVAKGAQAPLSLSASPSALVYGASATLLAAGGSGSGATTYSVSSGPCGLAGTSVTASGVGTCSVLATKAGDAVYHPASTTLDIPIATAPQAPLVPSTPTLSLGIGGLSALSFTGGSGTGAIAFVVTAGGSSCAIVGGQLQALAAGTCTVTATKAGDANYAATSATMQFTITRLPQATLVLGAAIPSLSAAGGQGTLSTSGGSGSGAVSYTVAPGSVSVCSVSGNTVTGLATGTCRLTATKAADATYDAATSASFDIPVQPATQAAFTTTATPAVISVNGSATLSSSGGSGSGAVSYQITAGASSCAISGTTVTGLGAGSCTVTASKAGDTVYGSATATVSITVGKAAQAALTPSATPASLTYGATATLTTTGGSGTGAISYQVTAGGSVCSLSGTTLTASGVGTCTVTASKAADGAYLAASGTVDITVAKAAQTPLTATATPASIAANGTTTLATTGGSGTGAVSWQISAGGTFCALSGTTVTGIAAGTCTLTATKAGDSNFTAATATVDISVGKAAQASLTASASPAGIVVNGTATLSTTGGSGSGAVSYQLTSGAAACALSGTTVTGLAAGSCTITATKAADAAYAAATAPVTIAVTKAAQAALTVSADPSIMTFKGSSLLSTVGGSGSGAVGYVATSSDTSCSIAGSVLTATAPGTCVVTATKAADASYAAATATVTVSVTRAAQAALTATAAPAAISYGGTSTLAATGGSGTGALSYSVSAGSSVCTISGNTVTATGVGTCTITASKAADSNYTSSQSSVDIAVSKAAQATFSASATPAGMAVGGTAALTSSGGSGAGAVTFTVAPASAVVCSITGSSVTGLAAGPCAITASKAGDANYTSATAAVTVMVAKAAQAPLTLAATPSAIAVNGTTTLAVAGGSGSGAVGYQITSGASFCTLAGTTVTGLAAGSCTVTATKAADASYSAASATVVVTVGKAAQSPLTIVATPPALAVGGSTSLAVAGGSGSGAVGYQLTSGASVCALSGTTLRGLAAGSCTVTATKAADAGFNAATATLALSVTAAPPATQTIAFTRPPSQVLVPGNQLSVPLSAAASSGLPVSFTSGSPSVCTVSGGTASILAAGTCTVTASQAGNASFAPASATQSFAITSSSGALALSASAVSVQPGQSLTLTASLTPGTLSGTVTFKDGVATLCGAVPVISGRAVCAATLTTAGSHLVTATFSGSSGTTLVSPVVAVSVGSPPSAGTGTTAQRFVAQRATLIVNNMYGGDRQIDRLMEAGGTVGGLGAIGGAGGSGAGGLPGGTGAGLNSGSAVAVSRLGAGPDATDLARMRGGHGRTSIADEVLRPGHFDDTDSADQPARRRGLPVDVSGNSDGASRFSFSTSLGKMMRANAEAEAAKADAAARTAGAGYSPGMLARQRTTFNPLDLWIEGKYASFRDSSSNIGLSGYFGMVSVGVDYVLNRKVLVGLAAQFDSMRESSEAQGSRVSGSGWMVGPYATMRLSENIFWQGRAAWGRASNDVDASTARASDTFGSDRRLIATSLTGRWSEGPWLLQPALSISYLEEQAEAHADAAGVAVAAATSRLGQAKAGPEIAYHWDMANGITLEPRAALQIVWDFASETKVAGAGQLGGEAIGGGLRGRSEIGLRAATASGIALDLSGSYDGIGSATYSAVAGRTALRVPLN